MAKLLKADSEYGYMAVFVFFFLSLRLNGHYVCIWVRLSVCLSVFIQGTIRTHRPPDRQSHHRPLRSQPLQAGSGAFARAAMEGCSAGLADYQRVCVYVQRDSCRLLLQPFFLLITLVGGFFFWGLLCRTRSAGRIHLCESRSFGPAG